MIRHLVLFKLNAGVTADDPRVRVGVETFEGLGGAVPEVASWTFVQAFGDRDVSHDYVIDSTFADPAALSRYLGHPAHRAAVALWADFATWAVADYEI